MSRRALFTAGALTTALLLSGCGGAGHQSSPPPAGATTGTTGSAGKTGTGLSDREVAELEKIVSGAESAADQAEATDE